MVAQYLTTLFFILFTLAKIGDCVVCEEPWVLYKDEQCVQLFPHEPFKTYTEAEAFCQTQAPPNLRPSLLLIKSDEFQTFVESTIYGSPDVFDSLWIGASFKAEVYNFTWVDGEFLSYTNWAPGYPRESTNTDRCVELRSPLAKATAQWYDVACGKRNMVACQMSTTWTIDEVVYELIKLRKNVADLQ